jgi:hypothetical protein
MRGLALVLPLLASCAATSAGPELQMYPAGLIAGAHFQYALGAYDALTWRVAGNFTERGDFGEHDDESGSGFGGGIGWRHIIEDGGPGDGWVVGARIDFWDLTIDWKDRNPTRRGSTDTLVIQPTIEGGYRWDIGGGWRAQLMAGLGAEINTGVEGEDVGEGAIMLVGVTFLHDI